MEKNNHDWIDERTYFAYFPAGLKNIVVVSKAPMTVNCRYCDSYKHTGTDIHSLIFMLAVNALNDKFAANLLCSVFHTPAQISLSDR